MFSMIYLQSLSHRLEMNKNTNNIEITNKALFILDKLSICSAVGYEINSNLSFHFVILK